MKTLNTLTDPTYISQETFSRYEKFWLKYMNDKRDLPFIHLLTLIHLTVLPVAIILFTPLLQGWLWWVVATVYFYVAQLYFKGRFELMFHCLCHRKTFKQPYQNRIHFYITWFICPLFGHAPEGYFSHHMGMHHVENNNETDTNSTMAYQRDSFKSFLAYFFNFLLTGVKETFQYLYQRKRKKLYTRLSLGEGLYLLFLRINVFCKS